MELSIASYTGMLEISNISILLVVGYFILCFKSISLPYPRYAPVAAGHIWALSVVVCSFFISLFVIWFLLHAYVVDECDGISLNGKLGMVLRFISQFYGYVVKYFIN